MKWFWKLCRTTSNHPWFNVSSFWERGKISCTCWKENCHNERSQCSRDILSTSCSVKS